MPTSRCLAYILAFSFTFSFALGGEIQPSVASTPSLDPALLTAERDKEFPLKDPYFASLTSQLLTPRRANYQVFFVPGLEGRDEVPLIETPNLLELALFKQPHAAPLVYLVAGTGGTALGASTLWLAEALFLKGFSVMTLPSPFNWKFVLSQSSLAVPGFAPEDARDLRRLILKARLQAVSNYDLKYTRQAVVGYSLGGINAAFLMRAERQQPTIGLERVVMINPPLDVPYALETVDSLNDLARHWTPQYKRHLWGYIAGIAPLVSKNLSQVPHGFQDLEQLIGLQRHQVQYLIGNSFRRSLAETLFVSQQIQDLGFLKSTADRYDRAERWAEINKISFVEYYRKILFPYWSDFSQADWNLNEFNDRGSLMGLVSLIESDSAFYLIHNEDDYLTLPSHLLSFARRMGPRAKTFKYGGHLGNLWTSEFQNQLYESLKDLISLTP